MVLFMAFINNLNFVKALEISFKEDKIKFYRDKDINYRNQKERLLRHSAVLYELTNKSNFTVKAYDTGNNEKTVHVNFKNELLGKSNVLNNLLKDKNLAYVEPESFETTVLDDVVVVPSNKLALFPSSDYYQKWRNGSNIPDNIIPKNLGPNTPVGYINKLGGITAVDPKNPNKEVVVLKLDGNKEGLNLNGSGLIFKDGQLIQFDKTEDGNNLAFKRSYYKVIDNFYTEEEGNRFKFSLKLKDKKTRQIFENFDNYDFSKGFDSIDVSKLVVHANYAQTPGENLQSNLYDSLYGTKVDRDKVDLSDRDLQITEDNRITFIKYLNPNNNIKTTQTLNNDNFNNKINNRTTGNTKTSNNIKNYQTKENTDITDNKNKIKNDAASYNPKNNIDNEEKVNEDLETSKRLKQDAEFNVLNSDFKQSKLKDYDFINVLDSDWVRLSFLNPSFDYKTSFKKIKFFTRDLEKFTNTRLGGNFAFNARPQFTRYADIRHRANDLKVNFMLNYDLKNETNNNFSFGLGRFYSEAIDDNQELVYLTFGVAKFNSIIKLLTNTVSPSLVYLHNTGRIDLAGKIGKVLGLTAGKWLFNVPMKYFLLAAGVYLSSSTLRNIFAGKNTNKFYYLKPTMHLYWSTVNTIVTQISVNLGMIKVEPDNPILKAIYKPFDNTTKREDINKTLDEEVQEVNIFNKQYQEQLKEMFPDLMFDNGMIDVFAMASRVQIQHFENLVKLAKTKEKGENALVDYYVKKGKIKRTEPKKPDFTLSEHTLDTLTKVDKYYGVEENFLKGLNDFNDIISNIETVDTDNNDQNVENTETPQPEDAKIDSGSNFNLSDIDFSLLGEITREGDEFVVLKPDGEDNVK